MSVTTVSDDNDVNVMKGSIAMRAMLGCIMESGLRSLLLVVAGMLALGIGVGASLGISGALASHDNDDIIHACVENRTGATRIATPGNAPLCRFNETLVEWQSANASDALAARVDTLEAENQALQQALSQLEEDLLDEIDARETELDARIIAVIDELGELDEAVDGLLPDCITTENGDVVFEGCNVHVRNGEGETNTTNGSGNLIIGYNEVHELGNTRTGSHNLVIGPEHSFSSFGGLVTGIDNSISGQYSAVIGGSTNFATGPRSVVAGGNRNLAQGEESVILGGELHLATGDLSAMLGGGDSDATGRQSTVVGGGGNTASGQFSSISGGRSNTASGFSASISGGNRNIASGDTSSILGGQDVEIDEFFGIHPD
jgi:hypothetical protein